MEINFVCFCAFSLLRLGSSAGLKGEMSVAHTVGFMLKLVKFLLYGTAGWYVLSHFLSSLDTICVQAL